MFIGQCSLHDDFCAGAHGGECCIDLRLIDADAADAHDLMAGCREMLDVALFMGRAALAQHLKVRVPVSSGAFNSPRATAASTAVRWRQLRWPTRSAALNSIVPPTLLMVDDYERRAADSKVR